MRSPGLQEIMNSFSLSESDPPNLIVGGDSVIGSELGRFWSAKGVVFHSTTRRKDRVSPKRPYVDLATRDWSALNLQRYAGVVLCAGISREADCRMERRATHSVNVMSTDSLVSMLNDRSRFILFLSSSQVFDGLKPNRSIHDEPSPVSEYGKQKAAAEKIVLGSSKGAVLRITKVLHQDWDLLRWWKTNLLRDYQIEAFTNRYFSPVELEKVIYKVDSLVTDQSCGLKHISGRPEISFFDFAVGLADQLLKPRTLVKGIECMTSNPPKFASLRED